MARFKDIASAVSAELPDANRAERRAWSAKNNSIHNRQVLDWYLGDITRSTQEEMLHEIPAMHFLSARALTDWNL